MSLLLGSGSSEVPTTRSTMGTGNNEFGRASNTFPPNPWGDLFATMSSKEMEVDESTKKRAEILKKDVKTMLDDAADSHQQLILINEIQRLGVAYHFHAEINDALEGIYSAEKGDKNVNDSDLHAVALRFRLLRQQGYNVSSDVFKKFKDEKGNFKTTLREDVEGLLSLYEAAYFGTREEEILDEAIDFSSKQLKSLLPHLSSPLSELVNLALDIPLLKRVERLQSRLYISIYQQDRNRNNVLLEFAKLDFNILQALHKKELSEISRWWKEASLPTKLPFARDRLVECYDWILDSHYEPCYSQARKISTQFLILASITDDIYDVYGKIEELELYTTAVERWEILDELPDYMKVHLGVIFALATELQEELSKEGRTYRIPYLKKALAGLDKGYRQEARWASAAHVPPLEEYINNGVFTSVYPWIVVTSLLGTGQVATKEAFEWVLDIPNALKHSCTIGRLMNDLVSNEFEQERVHVASAVQCCMNEFSITYEEAYKLIKERVALEWKDLNKECMKPIPVHPEVMKRFLNLARAAEHYYNSIDGYTVSAFKIKDYLKMMLLDSFDV